MRRNGGKKQSKIIITSICALLLIMTVGYAAMQANLEINAKGNIIKESSGGDALLEMVDIVTTGDGLYADTYEEGDISIMLIIISAEIRTGCITVIIGG